MNEGTWTITTSAEDMRRKGGFLLEGALDHLFERIGKIALIALAVIFVFGVAADHFRWGLDSTDSPTGKRSGLRLRTDYGTGCQYLETTDGFLTPRLGRDGKPVCHAA